MTAPATVAVPTRDELVTTALERLYWLEKSVKKPQTREQLHVSLNHISAIRLALTTSPLDCACPCHEEDEEVQP